MDYEKLSDVRRGEPSKVVRARVEGARERQRRRFAALGDGARHLLTNADTPAPRLRLGTGAGVGPGEIREFCPIDDAGHSLLRAAMRQLNMPTPGCFAKRAGVSPHAQAARTIADLAGAERIETAHLAEAIQYRPRWQVREGADYPGWH